ncbi:MAG: L-threonylcarbamoyladenylate synthase [Bacteroidales bacterium]|nr:L-threonylcarbamoyladenylate synthase [Bacteroidales bacterium]
MNYEDDIREAVKAIKNGGVILYPTDTIWGIGCDATNAKAVEKVYAAKHRTDGKSLIILVENAEMLLKYVDSVPPTSLDLILSYQKPLTVIYPRSKNLPRNLPGTDGSIAIRIPRTQFCMDLLKLTGKPIVSTSANITGEPAPVMYSRVSEEIRESVAYAVFHGRDEIREAVPSTIIRLYNNGDFETIRD